MAQPESTNFSKVTNDEFYSSFQYAALNPALQEIRLLRIDAHGRDHHELISCISLQHPPAFSALSYVCGSSAKTKTITVNGHCFNAFANLALAIDDVRTCWTRAYPEQELLLWTDQICINQSDDDERASQVAQMRNVYSSAEHTVIWLPASLDLGHDFANWSDCKAFLTQQPIKLKAMSPRKPRPAESEPVDRSARLVKDIAFAFHEVYSLARSEWWTRAWVYQEFLVSKSALFMIGPFLAPWTDIFELLKIYYDSWDDFSQWRYTVEEVLQASEEEIRSHMSLKGLVPFCTPSCDFCHVLYGMYTGSDERPFDHNEVLPHQYSDVLTAFAAHYLGFSSISQDKTDTRLSLSTAMKRSRGRKASEPRDKVYAYLGLLKSPNLIVPDYRSKLNALRVEVAQSIIKEDLRLDILAQMREDDRRSLLHDPLPSWVPTWSVLEDHRSSRGRYFSIAKFDELKVHNDPNEAAVFTFENDEYGNRGVILVVAGAVIDRLNTKIDDPDQNMFYGTLKNIRIRVGEAAHAGDQVWALKGMVGFLVMRACGSRHGVVSEAVLASDEALDNQELVRLIEDRCRCMLETRIE